MKEYEKPEVEVVIFCSSIRTDGTGGEVGDQKRIMTPAAAKEIGSDYIVVGRPITQADDPVAAYERCVAEFCD